MKNLMEELTKHIQVVTQKVNKIFEDSIKQFADPPIKGKITKGKLKYRGIKHIQKNGFLKQEQWIEQRGVRISPIISLTGSTTEVEIDEQYKNFVQNDKGK